MNIVDLTSAIKALRTWLKTNSVESIGDLSRDGFRVNPKNVEFSGEISSDFTISCDDVCISHVRKENDCAIVGFNIDTKTVTSLNQCISYKKMYNGNWDSQVFEASPLNETNFEGHLVLVCQYSMEESGEIYESYKLYTTPNFKQLREKAEKEDETRWLSELGARTASKNTGRR